MLKSLRKYAKTRPEVTSAIRQEQVELHQPVIHVPPIIWETGNVSQIRSLLVLREAELLLAIAQLTGNDYLDWYIRNRIVDLKIKVADLKTWLKEAITDKSDGD